VIYISLGVLSLSLIFKTTYLSIRPWLLYIVIANAKVVVN
jgi:hypothetical protein